MTTSDPHPRRRAGFTILELLMVISIMAVVATLATGAIIKSVRQARNRRVEATIEALEMALQNYRAQENAWPVSLNPQGNSSSVWFHSKDNAEVFRDLFEGGASGSTVYISGSEMLCQADGKRMTVREALNARKKEIVLGYAWPQNPNIFCAFCVEFKVLTDSVKVHRPDMRQAPYGSGDRVEGDHTCPGGSWGKVN